MPDADRIAEQLVGGEEARPSDPLHDFTAAWEGSRLVPYRDSAGYWTVGRGHKMQATDPRVPITAEEQEALFVADMLYIAEGVSRLIYMPIEQCKFDALCDFAFNLGLGALAGSTLRKRVNGGYFAEAADEFERWGHIHDPITGLLVVSKGVAKRRAAERAMFVDGDYAGRP
jgi:lysozyme